MAIVNGFIVHKIKMQKDGKPVPSHAEYMRRLHVELLALAAASLASNKQAEDLASVPLPPPEYHLQEQERKYKDKRRQHLCKVCSAMASSKTKGFESRYFCEACEELYDGYVPLCNCVRRKAVGNRLTCDQIWHDSWANGTAIPAHLTKNIRFRKRKRGDDE
ncbi:hypothetical protein L916_04274 [Phytophthora nicotianae]|uniref:PiggyBac transposable element-derived protein 4 C-terminal zinc-ribbon domain-containing protein n=1 Tax=Phytophthora nicotianae TaxID=4792 RepID=W2JH29_PHYNI|nr:hypothetical protein L916_04274 [Phytophthora nicotianae]